MSSKGFVQGGLPNRYALVEVELHRALIQCQQLRWDHTACAALAIVVLNCCTCTWFRFVVESGADGAHHLHILGQRVQPLFPPSGLEFLQRREQGGFYLSNYLSISEKRLL